MKAKLQKAKVNLSRNQDTLLITGDGRCMPYDVATFLGWNVAHETGSIGRSIKHLGDHVNHWWNADGETAIAWVKQIKAQSKNGLVTHTLGEVDGFDCDWDVEQPDYNYREMTNEGARLHGTSALFAVLTAIEMGYQRIVLAGCPIDSEGHWYWPKSKETLGPIWLGVDFMAWLDFAGTEDAKKVKSMSGYTAKILGEAKNEM